MILKSSASSFSKLARQLLYVNNFRITNQSILARFSTTSSDKSPSSTSTDLGKNELSPSEIVNSSKRPSADQPQTVSIAEETLNLTRKSLMPLNEDFIGPLSRKTDDRIPLPVVLVVGNHSSGKSTFINYCLKRRIQEAGVAPTDDGFTIIAPGERDVDQDGPSLVGDPDMGFSSLRSYGPSLVHHLRLKIRTNLSFKDIILIDSPGMIDSPTDSVSFSAVTNRGGKDRGYDFQGVTRWLAERADLILLFFDPDKPGTTEYLMGYTLYKFLEDPFAGLPSKGSNTMHHNFGQNPSFFQTYQLCSSQSKIYGPFR